MGRDVLVERHLIGAMAPPPEPVAIARLVDGDAVDPGPQARLTAEPMNRPEDAKEDFLGEVERLVAVAQQIDRQLDDHPLVLGDQLGARPLVAAAQRCTSVASRSPTSDQLTTRACFTPVPQIRAPDYSNLDTRRAPERSDTILRGVQPAHAPV